MSLIVPEYGFLCQDFARIIFRVYYGSMNGSSQLFLILKTADGTVVAKDHPIHSVPNVGARINWRGDVPPVIGTIVGKEEWTAINGITMLFEPDAAAPV